MFKTKWEHDKKKKLNVTGSAQQCGTQMIFKSFILKLLEFNIFKLGFFKPIPFNINFISSINVNNQ
jgi:hypothetical protein